MNFQIPVFPGDKIFRLLIIIKNKIGVTASQSEVAPPSLTLSMVENVYSMGSESTLLQCQ
jgi:hypothetical protein